jgi:hypothetical protein
MRRRTGCRASAMETEGEPTSESLMRGMGGGDRHAYQIVEAQRRK